MPSSRNELTETERITLVTVRVLAGEARRPVSTSVVIEQNWDNGRGSNYDQTNRALAGLVRKGYLTKPQRGLYEVSR